MHSSKKFHAALLSAAMFAGAVSPAASLLAAENGAWVKSGELYWYKNADGTWPANTWAKINGKWYHFNANGFMQSGWKKIDGQWYYLGKKNDGSMKTGWVYDNGTYYYCDSTGKMVCGWQTIGGKDYYFWSNGSMAKNTTVDGKIIGADGAVVKEETPALRQDLVEAFKAANEAAKLSQGQSNGYYSPGDVYMHLETIIPELCGEAAFKEFQNAGFVLPLTFSNGRTFLLPTDLFYTYLDAAGYDYAANYKGYKAFILEQAEYLKSIDYDSTTAQQLIGSLLIESWFPYSTLKPLFEELMAKGYLSETFLISLKPYIQEMMSSGITVEMLPASLQTLFQEMVAKGILS